MLCRLMTVSMTTAWEREEWALRAVKAVVRLRSPRCSRCRHCVMLVTCDGEGVWCGGSVGGVVGMCVVWWAVCVVSVHSALPWPLHCPLNLQHQTVQPPPQPHLLLVHAPPPTRAARALPKSHVGAMSAHLLLVHAPHKHATLVLPDLQVLALGAQQVLRVVCGVGVGVMVEELHRSM